MRQTLTAAHGAFTIPTGFMVARVVGKKPKFKADPDMREVVVYECFLSEVHGLNGLEPCEYLAERSRNLLNSVKGLVKAGLEKSVHMKSIAADELEVKYLA